MAAFDSPPDDVLVRYLLGEVPAPQADTLDERSVADPDFFERLEAVENDLVDGYVRGELPPDERDRFTRGYLTSAARADKVRFASALARRQKRAATIVPIKPRASRAVPWLLPVAATIAIVGLGLWFLPQNADLPGPGTPETQQAQQEQPPAPPPSAPPTPAAETPRPTATETVFAFTLAPPRRSAESLQSIAIPAGATDVTVRLELEFDDYPRYRAILKDPGTDRVLWRSTDLTSETQRASRVVPVMIPARHFAEGRYFIELEGVSSAGPAQPIATYAFRVVSQPAR